VADTDIEKMVRRSKRYKDKSERYIIENMVEAFKYKNKMDENVEKGYDMKKLPFQTISTNHYRTKSNTFNPKT